MKKWLICSALVPLLAVLCACSQRTNRSESEETLSKRRVEAVQALYPHVRFDSVAMVVSLDITREEAAALGVADELFDEMIVSVESMNDFIRKELKKNPDFHLRWDPAAFGRQPGDADSAEPNADRN